MADKKVLPLISIDEVQIPGYLIGRLKIISPELTNELLKNEIDINSGYLPCDTSKLRYPDNINMLVFFWIEENNEIIKTINLILYDAREFVCKPNRYNKNPETRIKFYIRSIFYELFRFREVFYSFLKKLNGYGIFTNKEANDLKFDFGNQFKEAIKIRNNLVHTDFPWAGVNFYKLSVVEGAKHFGKAIYNPDTETVMATEDVLVDIYHEVMPSLIVESQYIAGYLSNITTSFIATIENQK